MTITQPVHVELNTSNYNTILIIINCFKYLYDNVSYLNDLNSLKLQTATLEKTRELIYLEN